MKRFGLAVLAVAFVTAPAVAQDIDQIQAAPITTEYTAADQHLEFYNDLAGGLLFTITLADSTILQNELINDPVNFYLDGYLYDDRSSGGVMWGRFWGGILDIYWEDISTGDIYDIDGTLIALEVRETSECIFDGSGQFTVDNIVLPAGITWPGVVGSIATFTFIPTACDDMDDFTVDFTGIGFATLVPDGSGFPEPATCLLFAGLAIAAWRRR
jgi:hypothetical protein